MFNPVTTLREAGVPVDQLTGGQRAVLAALTPDETAFLVSVQQRLAAAEGEVVAHSEFKLL